MTTETRILAIDNRDSFVHLLADEFRSRACVVDVYRSNWPLDEALSFIDSEQPDLLLLSPGPGCPADAVLCMDLLREAPRSLPVFGVCLGHQCIVEHFGGVVGRSPEIMHGKPALVEHSKTGLMKNLESPMQVGRYHSLVAKSVPDTLAVDAECDGLVMAVHHSSRPVWGLQFHPESILTLAGGRVIDNLLSELERCNAR